MRNIRFTLVLLLFFTFSLALGRDIKILAIGNSFSEDAVEQYLYELAAQEGDTLIIGNAYRGGQGLQSHWNVVNNNSADFEYRKVVKGVKTNSPQKTLLYCIQDEDWDYITFQQVSQDAGISSTYEPWLTYLLNYVKSKLTNPQVQFAMHRTWAYAKNSAHSGFANYGNNQSAMYEAIVNAVNSVISNHTEINIIIPSGTAIQNGRESFLGDIFCRDGYHLTYGLGRYTAACTWLEIITGKSAIGNTYRPSSVSEIEALIAQHAAHYAVIDPDEITSMNNIGFEGENTIEPSAAIKVNFGNTSSSSAWNNIHPSNKYLFGLRDANNNDTQIVIMLDDDFNGTNTEGVQNTSTLLNMPQDVSSSCLWGYAKGTFGGENLQPTGGFLFSHLNKNLVYDFYFFASRKSVSDNRETQYLLQGENRKRTFLNASNNSNQAAFIKAIAPNDRGEIKLTISPGENNNNSNAFYYINALQITAWLYENGDFDNDEKDPMVDVIEGKKYYIRNTQTGLYLHALENQPDNREGDFCIDRLSSDKSTFEFQFTPVVEGKPVYYISAKNKYINSGDAGKCFWENNTGGKNAQIRLEPETDLTVFKMRALWNDIPNYINVDTKTFGACIYANKTDGALWKLEPLNGDAASTGYIPEEISVYQAFSRGRLNINTLVPATVKIMNLSGKIMDAYASNGNLVLDLEYTNGVYLIVVENGTHSAAHKIVLHR
jgi:hypothetical protein